MAKAVLSVKFHSALLHNKRPYVCQWSEHMLQHSQPEQLWKWLDLYHCRKIVLPLCFFSSPHGKHTIRRLCISVCNDIRERWRWTIIIASISARPQMNCSSGVTFRWGGERHETIGLRFFYVPLLRGKNMAMISDYFAINCACSISSPPHRLQASGAFVLAVRFFALIYWLHYPSADRMVLSFLFCVLATRSRKKDSSHRVMNQVLSIVRSLFGCRRACDVLWLSVFPFLRCAFFFSLALFLHKPLMLLKRNGCAAKGEHRVHEAVKLCTL